MAVAASCCIQSLRDEAVNKAARGAVSVRDQWEMGTPSSFSKVGAHKVLEDITVHAAIRQLRKLLECGQDDFGVIQKRKVSVEEARLSKKPFFVAVHRPTKKPAGRLNSDSAPN